MTRWCKLDSLRVQSPGAPTAGAAILLAFCISCLSVDADDLLIAEPNVGGPFDPDPSTGSLWHGSMLPDTVDPPRVPEDNPLTAAKIELGRYLFYDRRLSGNQATSCATCHIQALAFTDGQAVSTGSTGQHTTRSSASLFNTAFAQYLTWSNLVLRDFEAHTLVPLFGDTPTELGASTHQQEILTRLEADDAYAVRFDLAFPKLEPDERIRWDTVIYALASFQRTLVSFGSPYDRFVDGDVTALSPAAERGRQLFFSARLSCGSCHSGRLLSRAFPTNPAETEAGYAAQFRNTGLYNLKGRYPVPNPGIEPFTREPTDNGKHRIPSLRNVAVTAPYMHDGSVASLDAVLDHYAAGGRTLTGDVAGDGSTNPNKDPLVAGFTLTSDERADVLAFLHSLTDYAALEDPRFSDPFDEPG